jgi:UDP:flavonoid glycosyltransferase YjiC (YdhE family)
MVMRRALLAWEGGQGRGHVTTLKSVALALRGRFHSHAALCRLRYVNEIAPFCAAVFRGPRLFDLPSQRPARPSVAAPTWGEHLGDRGFGVPALISRHINWWQNLIRRDGFSLVVAEHAPCALMAARAEGVPAVAIGQGFGLPPAGMDEYPLLLPDFTDRLYDEAELVAAVNEAAVPLGVPPIRRLPEIYTCDDQLVRSLPMLDAYAEYRDAPYLPPIDHSPSPGRLRGEEVFVYLSVKSSTAEEVLRAIMELKLPVRAHLPAAGDDTLEWLAGRGVAVERGPIPMERIAERSRLLVNTAPHGSLCFGLAEGIPQVCIPSHLEQLHNARRATQLGAVRVIEKDARHAKHIVATVREAYEDAALQERAAAVAREVGPFFAVDLQESIRQRVSAIL